MNVVAIMGSPRKGDSYEIMSVFEDRIIEKGDVSFEYVWLKDLDLGLCRGCQVCIFHGEKGCPHAGELAPALEAIRSADAVAVISPVYALQMTGLMKNFLDHCSFIWHRPRFFKKHAVLLSVAAGGALTTKETLNSMASSVRAWGMHILAKKGMPPLSSLRDRKHYVEQIQNLADTFYGAVKQRSFPAPTLKDLIWFRIWRLSTSNGTPADKQYWTERGWNVADYFYPSALNPVSLLLVRLVEKIAIMQVQRTYK